MLAVVPRLVRAAARLTSALPVLALVVVAAHADAADCAAWLGYDRSAKEQALRDLIDQRLSSGELAENPGGMVPLRTCLEAAISDLIPDFDAACRDDASADLASLDGLIEPYATRCL